MLYEAEDEEPHHIHVNELENKVDIFDLKPYKLYFIRVATEIDFLTSLYCCTGNASITIETDASFISSKYCVCIYIRITSYHI